MNRRSSIVTGFFGFLVMLAVILSGGDAFAGGTVRLATPSPQERAGGSWLIRVRIDLPKEPALGLVPTRFTFQKTMVYERTIEKKGQPPVLHRLSINPAREAILSYDVKFSDPMGNVFKSTNFEFELKRSGGFFEAGEYNMQLSNADGDLGARQTVILNGDNPEVDRSAIDFSNVERVSSGVDAGPKPTASDDSASTVATAVAAVGTGTPFIPESAYNKTPEEELKDRPKGCGCSVVGIDGGVLAWAVPLGSIAALLVLARRRRTR